MQIYSTLAGISFTLAADFVDAYYSCTACEQSDHFLLGLKNICHADIQTSSQCCQYYKTYTNVCGNDCYSQMQELNSKIQLKFDALYETASYRANFHPTTAHSAVNHYLLFAQNMENAGEVLKAEGLERSLQPTWTKPVMTCTSCKYSLGNTGQCESPIQTSARCLVYYSEFTTKCTAACPTDAERLQQNIGFKLHELQERASRHMFIYSDSALASITIYKHLANAVHNSMHIDSSSKLLDQYYQYQPTAPQYHATAPQYHAPAPPAYNGYSSCDGCINGEAYLKDHRSICHNSIVPTVECYIYYNTMKNICPYKCSVALKRIDRGVEEKLNQMFSEARTKLRIFGRTALSETMLQEYITFAQGMGSTEHIAKGKKLNKEF